MKSRISHGVLLLIGLVLALLIGAQRPAISTLATTSAASSPDLATRISEIEQTWRGQYESHLGPNPETTSLTADQISATLSRLSNETHRNLALVYVFPHPDDLEVVLVIPDGPILQARSAVPQTALRNAIANFQSTVTQKFGQDYLEPAQQLYHWMITPIESDLQDHNVDTLIFCVGATLRSLPIAALHDGQSFLVEKYSLGLIPAFNLINTNYDGLKNARVLAMGASVFERLATLPTVPLELATVTQDLWQGESFLNQEFTLDNLKTQLESEKFAIVHLATHAAFRPGAPDNSFIQLWQDEQLDLQDIQNLDWRNLPVELLVLSACQTALGDQKAELGFAGLSFQSGVKSSLASLWRVSDMGTFALMREFYWHLANDEGTTKAEALRHAQIALLRGDVYIENYELHSSSGRLALPEHLHLSRETTFLSPYYWAAFTLVGSPW